MGKSCTTVYRDISFVHSSRPGAQCWFFIRDFYLLEKSSLLLYRCAFRIRCTTPLVHRSSVASLFLSFFLPLFPCLLYDQPWSQYLSPRRPPPVALIFLHAGECKLLCDRCKFHKLADRHVDVRVRTRRGAGIREQLRPLHAYHVVFHECLQQTLMARHDVSREIRARRKSFSSAASRSARGVVYVPRACVLYRRIIQLTSHSGICWHRYCELRGNIEMRGKNCI